MENLSNTGDLLNLVSEKYMYDCWVLHATIDRREEGLETEVIHAMFTSLRSGSGTILVSLHNLRESPGNVLHTSQNYPHY